VHGTAFAAAKPAFLAEDFDHHAFDVATLGDAVTMAAVGRADPVIVAEFQSDADAGCLLARIKVNETRHITVGEFDIDAIFKGANADHPAIGVEQLFPGELHASYHFDFPRVRLVILSDLVFFTKLPKSMSSRLPAGSRHNKYNYATARADCIFWVPQKSTTMPKIIDARRTMREAPAANSG
jgi:hypothetical protein